MMLCCAIKSRPIFVKSRAVDKLICQNHEEDFFQILCASQKVRYLAFHYVLLNYLYSVENNKQNSIKYFSFFGDAYFSFIF